MPTALGDHRLANLAVVADAVTTPLQALRRACVQADDLVVIVGVGGIGTYAVQIALAFGAEVAAVDVDPAKRERATSLGARWTFDPATTDARAIKKLLAAQSSASTARWRILEMSGTVKGQELAWSLLPPAGTLGVIGFTMDKPDIRLSNLMALNATAFGSWGCSTAHYPACGRPGALGTRQGHPLHRSPSRSRLGRRHFFRRGAWLAARRIRPSVRVPLRTTMQLKNHRSRCRGRGVQGDPASSDARRWAPDGAPPVPDLFNT